MTVQGTLKLASGTAPTANSTDAQIRAGTTGENVSSNMTGVSLTSAGQVYSAKSSYASNTAGWYLEYNSGTPRMNIGNATQYLKWTGSALDIGGSVTIGGTSTTLGNASSAYGWGDHSSGGYNTDSTSTIRGGTTKTDVGLSAVDNDSTSTIRGGTTLANISGSQLAAGQIILTNNQIDLTTGETVGSSSIYLDGTSTGPRILIADNS
jgi:hypothetical protein